MGRSVTLGGARGCVNTHGGRRPRRGHGLIALIGELSGKVGQYVTNKRDFQIIMSVRAVGSTSGPVAHWFQVQIPCFPHYKMHFKAFLFSKTQQGTLESSANKAIVKTLTCSGV